MLTQEQREAARQLREHYDRQKLFSSGVMLQNALGDILGEEGKKLRSLVRLAIDSGVGKLYLEQAEAPVGGFEQRVAALLENECGVASQVATDLKGFFDELAGFSSREPDAPAQPAAPTTASVVQPAPKPVSSPEPAPAPEPLRLSTPQPAAPGQTSAPAPAAEAGVSMKKLYLIALLPFLATILYSFIDRASLKWITNSHVAYAPSTPGIMLTHYYWYVYTIPFIVSFLLPLIVALVVMLTQRRKGRETSRATVKAAWLGALNAIAALLLGTLIFLMIGKPAAYNTPFSMFYYAHRCLIAFDFSYTFLLPRELPYYALSLTLPALAAWLARRGTKEK